jgi:hypothetical protein
MSPRTWSRPVTAISARPTTATIVERLKKGWGVLRSIHVQ